MMPPALHPILVAALGLLPFVIACRPVAPTTVGPPPPTGTPAATTRAATTQVTLRDWPSDPQVDPRDDLLAGPQRIICAAPNLTEICCALGLRERLVARTDYCIHPPSVAELPKIGALTSTNVEQLAKLTPDLILIAGTGRAIPDRLAPLGMRTELLPDRTLDDLFAAIARVAELTGRAHTAANLNAGIRADLDAIASQAHAARGQRVLLLLGVLTTPASPPFAGGHGSFYDGLLQRIGCTNAVPRSAPDFGELSLETIVRENPDVIVELDADGRARPDGDAGALRAWRQLPPIRAATSGRVYVIRGPEHQLLGPRIAQTLRVLLSRIEAAPATVAEAPAP